MKRISRANLEKIGERKGSEYLKSVLDVATIEGEMVAISEEDFARLHPVIAPPTLPQMAGSLASSVTGWAKSGFSLATPEQLESRMEICKGCEFWDDSGFGGTGRCLKCGCSTQAKLRMATSTCPDGKW